VIEAEHLLHGNEAVVYADAGYTGAQIVMSCVRGLTGKSLGDAAV